MPKLKKAKTSKKTNKNRKKRPATLFGKKISSRLLIFMLAFGVIGGYLTFRSFALSEPVTVAGRLYKDNNRSATFDAGDEPLAAKTIYLYNGTGTYLGNRATDAEGKYVFTEGNAGILYEGTYRVAMAAPAMWELWNTHTPTTIRGEFPQTLNPNVTITTVGGQTTVQDFGWRPVVFAETPITEYTGTNGLRAKSYNDVIPAKFLYDQVMKLGMIGNEVSKVEIINKGSATATGSSMATSPPPCHNAASLITIGYNRLVQDLINNIDSVISHEYGHAWSLIHGCNDRNDVPDFVEYQKARGLYGDARLNTSYGWDIKEIFAEDYRQFWAGNESGRNAAHLNKDIPAAKDVPGLYQFLTTTYITPLGGTTPTDQSVVISELTVSPDPVLLKGKTSAKISYKLSTQATSSVYILNASGSAVKTLTLNTPQIAGQQNLTWNRTGLNNRKVSAGTYSVKVESKGPDGKIVTLIKPFTVK